MGGSQERAKKVYCDSNSTIAMEKNLEFHGRTKHIGIKYHFTKEAKSNQEINIKHCKTDEQLVYIFTKALLRGKFELLCDIIGVIELASRRSDKLMLICKLIWSILLII